MLIKLLASQQALVNSGIRQTAFTVETDAYKLCHSRVSPTYSVCDFVLADDSRRNMMQHVA